MVPSCESFRKSCFYFFGTICTQSKDKNHMQKLPSLSPIVLGKCLRRAGLYSVDEPPLTHPSPVGHSAPAITISSLSPPLLMMIPSSHTLRRGKRLDLAWNPNPCNACKVRGLGGRQDDFKIMFICHN